ncbi:competence regulator inhibitor paratox [Streptococcus suis]|uniref:competence regulator inhibitor paratox n=1 Tax=Streptococcus parasuis TaxID=1501662 RepID=UPI003CC7CF2E
MDRGFINHDTIMTSRINGQLHDYILEGEPIDLVKHFYTLVLQKCLTRSKSG